jgi:hypothetical protein
MIEYPSIINSSKAPRKAGIAFDKLDGSNFRAKWTKKKNFHVFGTRTQLIDETTPFWGDMVNVFRNTLEDNLIQLFQKEFKNDKEIIVFGEYVGDNSFAGIHVDEPKKIILFDVMVCNVQRKFLRPQDFIKIIGNRFEIPKIIYRGNLNEEFIKDVRNNKFNLNEGVIFKGTEPTGNAVGGIWQCKIKTNDYIEKLKQRFQENWTKYGE